MSIGLGGGRGALVARCGGAGGSKSGQCGAVGRALEAGALFSEEDGFWGGGQRCGRRGVGGKQAVAESGVVQRVLLPCAASAAKTAQGPSRPKNSKLFGGGGALL